MFSSRVRRIIQPFRPRFLLKSRAKVIGTPCSRSYSALTESFVKGELEPPLLEETIYANFADKVQRFGDRPCVVSRHQGDEGRLTYSALDDAAARLASGFLELGLKPGDRVAMWSFNNWEWIAMQIATARVGLVLVNLSPAYTAPELRHALSLTGCKAVVTQVGSSSATGADHQFMDVIREVIPEIDGVGPGGTVQSASFPELEFIIGTASTDNVPLTNGVTPFQDLMTADPTSPALIAASEGLHIDDAINIQFTSGTTGLAKGTTLTHRNILNNGNQIGSRMGLTPNDSVCVPVPMFHCFGLVLGSLAALTHGSSVVFPAETFDPLATLQVVHDERCTALHGVPTMFLAELNHPRFKEFDLSSLRTGIMAGTLCPVDVMRRVVSDMNITEMTVCYGMTETSPVTFQTKRSDGIGPRTSSIGTVHPHVEAKIVAAASEEDDDSDINSDAPPDGTPLPVGEAGELWTRGYVVMKGYWNEPDKTEEAIVDGCVLGTVVWNLRVHCCSAKFTTFDFVHKYMLAAGCEREIWRCWTNMDTAASLAVAKT